MEQRTLEWYNARLGHFTASDLEDLCTSGRAKKGEATPLFGETAKAIIRKKAAERFFAEDKVANAEYMEMWYHYNNASSRIMDFGVKMEPIARQAYEQATGLFVQEVGFIRHPTIPWLGASPDGVTEENGKRIGLEIKNLTPAETMRTVLDMEVFNGDLKAVTKAHFWQTQCQMMCAELEAVDYVVYCEILEKPLYIWRQYPVPEAVEEITRRVEAANMLASSFIGSMSKAAYGNGD